MLYLKCSGNKTQSIVPLKESNGVRRTLCEGVGNTGLKLYCWSWRAQWLITEWGLDTRRQGSSSQVSAAEGVQVCVSVCYSPVMKAANPSSCFI